MEHSFPRTARRSRTAICMAWLTALALVACGSSDEPAAADAPDTSASGLSVGPISAVSGPAVMVNGVRFDMSSATLLDNDDQPAVVADLEPGMPLEVVYESMDRNAGTARALQAGIGATLLGPVTAVDPGTGEITVIGQKVQVRSSTVFARSLGGGLAGLATGQVIAVTGLLDAAAGVVRADRIVPGGNPASFRLYGVLAGLDAAAKTFTVGSQGVGFAGLAAGRMPATLANGMAVRVQVAKTAVGGLLPASRIRADAPPAGNGQALDLEGVVTAFTSAASFTIAGTPVNAASARATNAANLKTGARVRANGRLVGGVLQADAVTVVEAAPLPTPEPAPGSAVRSGVVSNLDAAAGTFRLGNLVVDFSGAVFSGGAAAELVNEVTVQVSGVLSADGASLAAQRIDFQSVKREGAITAFTLNPQTVTVAGTVINIDTSQVPRVVVGPCCRELETIGQQLRVFGPLTAADGSAMNGNIVLVLP